MSKTRQKLPVVPYLYKWLVNRLGYKEGLELTAPMPAVRHSPAVVYAHFRTPGLPEVWVLGYYPNQSKLYSLHQNLLWLFNQDMLGYVQRSVNLGIPAKTALEEFLRICHIEEDEMQIATAYKRWQRKIRNEIPGLKVN